MCIERYFFINLLMDFSICAAVAWSLGCFRLRRVASASALGASYALLARAAPIAAALPVQLALLLPIALLLVGRGPLLLAMAAGLSLPTTALATGACAILFGMGRFGAVMLPLPALMSLAPRLRKSAITALPATFEVHCRGATARFPACVDTGNRLTEPLSGEPVLIASAKLVEGVLPARGYRQVCYGSVGGGGALACFRPEALYILQNGRRRRMPEAWIAVFPDRLPGAFQALAPAAFALY